MTYRIPLSSFVDQTARTAAAAAQQTANNAQTAAGDALAVASSRNHVIVSPTAPTTQTVALAVDDVWVQPIDPDDATKGSRLHTWDGSTWQPVTFGTSAIAAAAITADLVAAGAIGAGAIAADAIDGKTINGATITAGTLDTGAGSGIGGVKIYQGQSSLQQWGVVEFRDGLQGDSPSTITATANLADQGGGAYTEQGGSLALKAGIWNGVQGPALDLNVESAPAGGYQPVARLAAAGGFIVAGPLSVTGDGAWTAYTPTWTTLAPGVAPSVGNGTLIGRYRSLGRLVEVDIALSCGSATNAGGGGFLFSLPVPAASGREQWLLCKAVTTDLNTWAGSALITSGDNRIRPCFPKSSSNNVLAQAQSANATSPGVGQGIPLVAGNYAFTNGSNVIISGRYEAASS